MSQEQYDELIKDGGCVFETRGKICRAAVALGKRHCPRHQAQIDAVANRAPATTPAVASMLRRRNR